MNPETENTSAPAKKKPGFFSSLLHLLVLIMVLLVLVATAIAVNRHKSTKPAAAPPASATTSPSLTLSPGSESVKVGDSLTVAIWEDSGSQSVNAVQANMSYPSATFQFVSVDDAGSAFEVAAQSKNTDGSLVVARGHVGSLTGRQLVAKVTFKALAASAKAKISFDTGSQLAGNSGKVSKDILGQKIDGTYTVEAK